MDIRMAGVHNGRTRMHLPMVAAIVAYLAGCGGKSDAGKRPLSEMGQEVRTATSALPAGMTVLAAAQLDSGNVAFRIRQYESATRFYRAAANDVPEHPAPWYGMLMVAQATGDRALADSAMRAVAVRTGGSELLDTGNVKAHKASTSPH